MQYHLRQLRKIKEVSGVNSCLKLFRKAYKENKSKRVPEYFLHATYFLLLLLLAIGMVRTYLNVIDVFAHPPNS